MSVARLILNYNTPQQTEELCRMVPGAIVIDNGSPKPYTGKNRCIRLSENYGFTKGWNEGIKAVYNEFDAFWLMNSDITISPGNVARIMEVLEDHPEVMLFTPTYNCWMNHCRPQSKKGLIETTVLEFTAPVFRKEVFEKIGFFDQQFALGYGVEFDFCYRMRQAGLGIFVDHSSKFYHIGHQTIKANDGIVSYSKKANFELTHGLLKKYGWDWMGVVLKGVTIKTNFDMNIAVYTTIFGDYDKVRLWPKQNINASYYVVTDNPDLHVPDGWQVIVPDFPRKQLGSRLRAKFFKLFPWELEELAKHNLSIYVDGSIEVQSQQFIDHCIRNLDNDMLLYKHPQRGCIYDEALASKELRKYKDEPIDVQAGFYRKFFHRHKGLYAGGILVRKHTDKIVKIMGDWWFENIKFSYQDQLSLPVVFWANKFTPSTFKENQYNNEFFKVRWHDDPESGEQSAESKGQRAEGGEAKAQSKVQRAKSQENAPSPAFPTLKKFSGSAVNHQDRILLKETEIPYFSIVMPVYNTDPELLKKAVQSIYRQSFWESKACIGGKSLTDEAFFKTHEFIIVDDGSDNHATLEYLKGIEDLSESNPVRILHRDKNYGLANTLDWAIKNYARGEVIVRMDSDDIALPDLLQEHHDFFTGNPDKNIHGVQIELFTNDRTWSSQHSPVVNRSKAFKNKGYWLMNHPGSAFRKSAFINVGGYGDTLRHLPEDYVLWCKFLQAGYKLYNSEQVLLRYRAGDGSQIGQDRKSDEWINFLRETKNKYLGVSL